MPSVEVYFEPAHKEAILECLRLPKLREVLARLLTCPERTITPKDFSFRPIEVVPGFMLTPVELKVLAHAYPLRVKRQDSIARAISNFLGSQKKSFGRPKVWVPIGQVGFSF